MTQWLINGSDVLEEIPEGYIGFVYQITNLLDGRKYIGRKNFFQSKTKQIKGKKKKYKAESNWKEYNSSSDELKADIEKLGIENFKKEILYLAKSIGNLNYIESKLIFINECLESELWYNSWVSCKIHKRTVKLTL